MGSFFFGFSQWHRDSKPDFNQGCQLLLHSTLRGEAGLREKFLQVPTVSPCDRNTVLFIFCPALLSWYGHHSAGDRNASQFRVAFSSPCLLLSSPAWHTHGGNALQVQSSREAFLKSNLNSLLSCIDGKKCWTSIETRAVPVPRKRGTPFYTSQSDLKSARSPRGLVSTSIYICITLIGIVATLTVAGKVFPHFTKIVKAWIYPEECEGWIPQLAPFNAHACSGSCAGSAATGRAQGLFHPLLAHRLSLVSGGAMRLSILNQGKQTQRSAYFAKATQAV